MAVPVSTPETTPAELIAAMVPGTTDHVPPVGVPVSARVSPGQIAAVPVIAPGKPFTVIVAVTLPHATV